MQGMKVSEATSNRWKLSSWLEHKEIYLWVEIRDLTEWLLYRRAR